MSARQFRKRPVVIEAVQWTGRESCDAVHDFVGWPRCDDEELDHSELNIPTLEGTMIAQHGDWIIRGVQGEFYPCKPDIFEATYEPLPEPAVRPDTEGAEHHPNIALCEVIGCELEHRADYDEVRRLATEEI